MAAPNNISGSNKRKRNDEDVDLEPAIPIASATRSGSVWFDDGNIIIQAEGTIFKVYRGVLAAHSSVFKDMLSIPQPSSEGLSAIEGCAVVHVSDTAADITIVLEALCLRGYVQSRAFKSIRLLKLVYATTCRHGTIYEALNFKVVAAFIRIGKKYDIPILRNEGLKRLSYEYPSDFNRYCDHDPWSRIFKDDHINIAAANLAREQNLLWVLPVALYRVCDSANDAKDIVKGIHKDDGVTALALPNDITTCLVARESLLNLQSSTTFAWTNAQNSVYPSCRARSSCTETRKQKLCDLYFPRMAIAGLNTWEDANKTIGGKSMCDLCAGPAKKLHEKGREELWNALPGIFGLPKWVRLQKERDQELLG